MDPHEAAAIAAGHANYAHQWNLGGRFGRAFGDVVGSVVSMDAERAGTVQSALEAAGVRALCLTLPAHWFDVSAERLCDIMHAKSVYMMRAAAYANNAVQSAAPRHDMMRAYVAQMFFQIAAVLWRWRDKNDRIAWTAGASDSDSSSSSEDDRPRKRRKRKPKRKRLLGRARDECGMVVDWRWREMCQECVATREHSPWRIVFCDHVERPADMSPVLDYTFWFLVRGWSARTWEDRVGRAAIAVMRQMHLASEDLCTRAPDGSDAWKDVNTPEGLSNVMLTYLQAMGYDLTSAYTLHSPRGNTVRVADLLAGCNPVRVFTPQVTTAFWTTAHASAGAQIARRALLHATSIEVQATDASAWKQFWHRYLPHYDLLCMRPFATVFPGVYHATLGDFEAAKTRDDALRTITYGGSPEGCTAPPVRTNADTTAIWQLVHEATDIARDGSAQLQFGFLNRPGVTLSPEERAVVPLVWRYVARKRAFIKYVLQCRTPESHVSHALVSLWKHYYDVDGAVYDPALVRPAYGTDHATCPWDYYYHNLTPFGNWMVNHAYALWNHYYVDPPQVATGVLVLDAAANATRGEHYNVGLNPLVYSSDPKAGKSFVTGELLARTRVPGTWTASSYKSAGAQHIHRMGTHDDMVVYVDEVKRGMFVSKDDGGMADPKQKELMTNGFVQSHVLVFTGGDGHNSRSEQTYTYNELGTLVATGNLAFMNVADKPFLSRWLMRAHNKCPRGVSKRPRVAPRPPPHIVHQLHQLQFAVTEVHKMIQIGAMDAEDTTVVDIMLEALGDALQLTPDTQRKDMQIKNLARIHAVRDCIVTHFWLPGGLFYGKRITPSRLFALNDFLMVRAEHVVFAIGQLCSSATDTPQYAITRAIVELWRAPGTSVGVQWGTGMRAHDADYGDRLGFAPHLAMPCYDTVVFEGQGRGFLRHFCATLHHIIATRLAEGVQLVSIPTADQIESYLRRWMTEMYTPTRAEARGGGMLTRPCHPDSIQFTTEPISPEMQCCLTEVHGVVRIKFPTHMLCNTAVHQTAIEGTPLEAMLSYSSAADARLAADVAGADTAHTLPTYLYGGTLPGHRECYAVLDIGTAYPRDTKPTLPYRHYEAVMTDAEYTSLSGAPPPAHRDTPVPMVIPLDEFAARSRIRAVAGLQAHVSNDLFASTAAKMVLGVAAGHTARADLHILLRTTAMVWGVLYRAPSDRILDDMHSARSAPPIRNGQPRALVQSVLCEYSTMSFCRSVCTPEDVRAMVSPVFVAMRRKQAMERTRCVYATPRNAYRGRGILYPETLPSISQPREAPADAPQPAPKRARTEPTGSSAWVT